MKKLFLVLILFSAITYAQKTVTPTWVKGVISDSLAAFQPTVIDLILANSDTILSGTATINVGADSVIVTHGLGSAPLISNINVSPQENYQGMSYWVQDVTSTTFKIKMDTTVAFDDVTEAISFSWQIFNADLDQVLSGSENVKEVGTDRAYTTISSAITAASDGDVIKIYNGTYSANLVVNKSVTIIGERATITGTVNVFADNVILKDLDIAYTSDSALVIDGADNVLIDNVNITGTATKLRFLNSTNVKLVNGTIKTLKVSYENSDVIFNPTKHFIYNGGNWCLSSNSTVEYQTILRMLSTVTGNDTITRATGSITNGSEVSVLNSDMVLGLSLYDSSNVHISNSKFTRYPYFNTRIDASGLLEISNTYVEMNYPDTVSGLHIFEMASNSFPNTTAKIRCYNSHFVFGNDYENIRMGGALGALTADTMAEFSAYNSTFISYVDDISTLAYAPTFNLNRPYLRLENCVVKCIDRNGTQGAAIQYNEVSDNQIKADIINTYLEAPLKILEIRETLTTNQVKLTDTINFVQNTVNCVNGEDSLWFDTEITEDYKGRDSVIKYGGTMPTLSNDAVTAIEYDTIRTKILFIGDNQDHELIPVYPPTYSTYVYGGTLFSTAVIGDTIYIKFTWNQSLMYKQAYAECLLGSAQNDDSTRTQMWSLNVYQGGSGKGTYGRTVVDTSLIFDTPDGYYELGNIKYYDSGTTYLTVMAQLDVFSQAQARKQVISLFIKSQYLLDNVTISLTP